MYFHGVQCAISILEDHQRYRFSSQTATTSLQFPSSLLSGRGFKKGREVRLSPDFSRDIEGPERPVHGSHTAPRTGKVPKMKNCPVPGCYYSCWGLLFGTGEERRRVPDLQEEPQRCQWSLITTTDSYVLKPRPHECMNKRTPYNKVHRWFLCLVYVLRVYTYVKVDP